MLAQSVFEDEIASRHSPAAPRGELVNVLQGFGLFRGASTSGVERQFSLVDRVVSKDRGHLDANTEDIDMTLASAKGVISAEEAV